MDPQSESLAIVVELATVRPGNLPHDGLEGWYAAFATVAITECSKCLFSFLFKTLPAGLIDDVLKAIQYFLDHDDKDVDLDPLLEAAAMNQIAGFEQAQTAATTILSKFANICDQKADEGWVAERVGEESDLAKTIKDTAVTLGALCEALLTANLLSLVATVDAKAAKGDEGGEGPFIEWAAMGHQTVLF